MQLCVGLGIGPSVDHFTRTHWFTLPLASSTLRCPRSMPAFGRMGCVEEETYMWWVVHFTSEEPGHLWVAGLSLEEAAWGFLRWKEKAASAKQPCPGAGAAHRMISSRKSFLSQICPPRATISPADRHLTVVLPRSNTFLYQSEKGERCLVKGPRPAFWEDCTPAGSLVGDPPSWQSREAWAESSPGSDVPHRGLHSVQYVHCCRLRLLKIFFNVLKKKRLLCYNHSAKGFCACRKY